MPCGKGTVDPIQVQLFPMTTHGATTVDMQSQISQASFFSVHHNTSVSSSERDFLKISTHIWDQYSVTHKGSNIETVEHRFIQDCDTFDAPEVQRLSVLHTMLRNDALQYFMDYIAPTAIIADQAFRKLHAHFLTPAHKVAYMTELNSLTFNYIKQKHPTKSTTEVFDHISTRSRLAKLTTIPFWFSTLTKRQYHKIYHEQGILCTTYYANNSKRFKCASYTNAPVYSSEADNPSKAFWIIISYLYARQSQ